MRLDIIVLRLLCNVQTVEFQTTSDFLFTLEDGQRHLQPNYSNFNLTSVSGLEFTLRW
jgi:hypothetical protein